MFISIFFFSIYYYYILTYSYSFNCYTQAGYLIHMNILNFPMNYYLIIFEIFEFLLFFFIGYFLFQTIKIYKIEKIVKNKSDSDFKKISVKIFYSNLFLLNIILFLITIYLIYIIFFGTIVYTGDTSPIASLMPFFSSLIYLNICLFLNVIVILGIVEPYRPIMSQLKNFQTDNSRFITKLKKMLVSPGKRLES